MLLSYNVIKKDYVNSNTVYAINPPLMPVKKEAPVQEEAYDAGIDLEEMRAYAQSLIDDADAKARQIIARANEEAERIKKDAYEAAFKKGYSEGLKKGTEDGYISIRGIRQDAENVLKEAHSISRQYIDNEKNEIINLSLHIARKIIGYQADVSDSVIINIVSEAIGSAVAKEQMIIRVNPMDYAFVDCRRDEFAGLAGENVIVNIVKDNSVQRGGCKIETEAGSVDASIDSQMEKIKEVLIG